MAIQLVEQPSPVAGRATRGRQKKSIRTVVRNGSRPRPKLPTMFIMGTRIDNVRETDALNIVRQFAAHPPTPGDGVPARQVFFTNVHTIYVAKKDRGFMRTVNRADLVLPDGAGLKFYGSMNGTPVLENLNGTDFTPKVLEIAAHEGWSVYLVGSKPGIIDDCSERMRDMFPSLSIVGCQHGYFSPEEERRLIEDINEKRPNILLVAMGSPAQEKWIARHSPNLCVGVCFAVGGLFDFIAGEHQRAPLWMRKAGLEWAYRFYQDPKTKWNRVCIEIPWFIARVIARRFMPRKAQLLLRQGSAT